MRLVLAVCALAAPGLAQCDRGELHLEVQGPQGALLSTVGELVSEANPFSYAPQLSDKANFFIWNALEHGLVERTNA
jgi:hypothetical protein